MKSIFALLCSFILSCSLITLTSCREERPQIESNGRPFRHVVYYQDSLHVPLTEIVKRETDQGQVAVLHFGATWCGPCRKFEAALNDSLMLAAMSGVTLISIDIDDDVLAEDWSGKNNIHAVPTFVKVDASCNALRKIDSGEWDDDTPEQIAPVMKDFVR
jgi:thiol-disulfide isomerase/thioredoxin